MQTPSKFFLLILLLTLGCEDKKNSTVFERKENFETVSVGQGNQETMIPSEVWDRLEQFYAGSGATIEEKIAEQGATAKAKNIEVPVVFMPVKVFLTEKSRGALGGQNFKVSFDQGGGVLDLKNYVKKDFRSFYFAVEIGELKDNGSLKVFFVSNAKEARIGKESYGAGCEKYMDVTSYYDRVISKVGIELSTAGNRYVHVVAGTYIFALVKNSSLFLTQVTVLDSRFKKSLCRA